MRLGAYGDLLRTPGFARVAATGTTAGVAAQGMPVALVLLGRDATGSFAAAGTILLAGSIGMLTLAPARGRLVDRRGPRRMLPLLAAAATAAGLALVAAAEADAPLALLAALALLAGACSPPTIAVLRTTWRNMARDDAARHTAFGLLTVLQEVAFFTGPLLAGAIVGLASAAAAVAALAALGLAGTLAFATSHHVQRARPANQEAKRSRIGVLVHPGMRTVAATAALAGATFGLLDVALPAVATHDGHAGAAGVLLSALALGIGIGGFAYGLRPPRTATGRIYAPLNALAAAGLVPLAIVAPQAATIAATAVLLVLAGLLFAPLTTAQFALVDDVSPPGTTTEAMAVIGTAYGAFAAVGAQAAGALVDESGLRAPFAAACGCMAVAAAVAAIRRRSLTGSPATIGRE